MKKITLSFLVLLISFACFSQDLSSKSYEELMQKSRKSRTTSIIMVSAGPVIAAGGVGTLIYGLISNADRSNNSYYDYTTGTTVYTEKKHTTEIVVGAAATLVGMAMAIGSIHFTQKAHKLRNAARVIQKTKLQTSMQNFNIPNTNNNYASVINKQFKISLMISLGK